MICPICRSFKRGTYPNSDLWAKHPYDRLLSSCKSCQCCDIIVRGCRGLLLALNRPDHNITTCELQLAYENGDGQDESDCDKVIALAFSSGEWIYIEFFAAEDADKPTEIPKHWDDFPTGRRTTHHTESEEALGQVQTWIEECTTDHEDCPSRQDRALPTRLVSIGLHNKDIMLVETQGQQGSYAALSHCWGKKQIIVTTLSTIKDHKAHIAFGKLPKTFQDAIQITRRLGIQFIWIDSLCIVQDDADDWAREASKMATFYENAMVTIAATSSSAGDGGLFRPTPDYLLSGTTSEGDKYTLVFRERIEHELMDAGSASLLPKFPFLSRAWGLQERLLSPRVVHFGPYELFFECRMHTDCECREIVGFEIANPAPKLMYAEALGCIGNPRYLSRVWRAVVGLYTGLFLTYKNDIFPALGGLASQMSRIRGSQYLAGLWKDSLNEDLLWRSGPTGGRLSWRAPTWSWASVDHPIYYNDAPLFWHPDEAEDDSVSYERFVSIGDARVDPKAVDNFGELRSGMLQLHGRCIECSLHYWGRDELGLQLIEKLIPQIRKIAGIENGLPKAPKMKFAVQFPSGVAYEIIPDYALDKSNSNHVPNGSTVRCLLMSLLLEGFGNTRKRSLYALVLVCHDSPRENYERIGLLVVDERQNQDVDFALSLFTGASEGLVLV